MAFKYLCLLTFIIFLLFSCDSAEEEPAVLEIRSVRVETTDDQGAPTDRITDLYLNTTTDELGAFPIPAVVPIFSEGPTELIIAPGIRVNGTRGIPRRYFPLEFEVLNLDLNKGVDNEPIDVVFKYRDNAAFAFIEDFEDGVEFFVTDLDEDLQSRMEFTDVNVRSGSGAGLLRVSEDQPLNVVGHSFATAMSLEAQRSIFLEMDYLLTDALEDVLFTVAIATTDLAGQIETTELLTLNPREDWNKIYFDLGTMLLPVAESLAGYAIIFTLQAIEENGVVGSGQVVIDNVKLVYE